MSGKKKSVPLIGTIFSSDSSDEDAPPRQMKTRRAQTSASESERVRRKVRLKVNLTSASDNDSDASTSLKVPLPRATVEADASVPDGYTVLDKSKLNTINHNTLIQYEKPDGKMIQRKYFKKVDRIADTILLGFYRHNKRNYSEKLDNIKTIFVQSASASGGGSNADQLKGTIEVPPEEWKTLRRDMIVSYKKNDGDYIHRAKFNSFLKGRDNTSRMSFTSEQGFSYTANPNNIAKLYRHFTGNDRTLSFILETLRKLEQRVHALEQKKSKRHDGH